MNYLLGASSVISLFLNTGRSKVAYYGWILRPVSVLVEYLFKQKAVSDQDLFNPVRSALVLSLLLSLAVTTVAQLAYVGHSCRMTATSAENSTFKNNLESVLTSLSNNTHLRDGFYSYTFGDEPDQVYGISMCTAGLSSDVCKNCVGSAAGEIVRRCPSRKVGIIWYDECLLRYSYNNIFSVRETSPMLYMWNPENLTDPIGFYELMMSTIRESAAEASRKPTGSTKFAVKESNFTANQTIYTFTQCTADLSGIDCSQCLNTTVPLLQDCCGGRLGGRILTPSCNIRYEIYQFYNISGFKPEIYAPSPSPSPPPPPTTIPGGGRNGGVSTTIIIVIVASVSLSISLIIMGCIFLRRRARKKYNSVPGENTGFNEFTTMESLLIDLDSIQVATNNFSENHKLGEGGFGEVYQGTYPNGQEIAVKKLSRSSAQGSKEFKNEILLLAKLIHRNLVRLLGFCLEGEEKILVYEYVPNKSLDVFLFDEEKRRELDWSSRYKIVGGIARGILYLHEDSRLRIIHRDLKASNILLDRDMNPKISDFGMAKIFAMDQTQGNTSRIVGTYGYMSPEYAMHGQFSVKSDMYSFGVLILEIICGKKNSSFYQTEGAHDLSSYVWKHWREGTPMEVLDPVVADSYSRNEVLRCIQIGLLCVQEDPANRPTMATVVLMLDSYSVTLPTPQQPAFFLHSGSHENCLSAKSVSGSVDEASITQLEHPRHVNTCIDRGSWRDTVIGDHSKTDNLVQIGHNVVIGENCMLCGQVGIAGSVTIGDYVVMGGRVAVRDHVSIASKVRLAANRCVTKDITEPGDYGGFPAVPAHEWRRQVATYSRISKKNVP